MLLILLDAFSFKRLFDLLPLGDKSRDQTGLLRVACICEEQVEQVEQGLRQLVPMCALISRLSDHLSQALALNDKTLKQALSRESTNAHLRKRALVEVVLIQRQVLPGFEVVRVLAFLHLDQDLVDHGGHVLARHRRFVL